MSVNGERHESPFFFCLCLNSWPKFIKPFPLTVLKLHCGRNAGFNFKGGGTYGCFKLWRRECICKRNLTGRTQRDIMKTFDNNLGALNGKAIKRDTCHKLINDAGPRILTKPVQHKPWSLQTTVTDAWREKVCLPGLPPCSVFRIEANRATIVILISLLTWLYTIVTTYAWFKFEVQHFYPRIFRVFILSDSHCHFSLLFHQTCGQLIVGFVNISEPRIIYNRWLSYKIMILYSEN